MAQLNKTTESEQMYLVSMARLAEVVEECPIPVSKVADLLGVTSISANQMIHNLEEMGLVSYTPYRGVEFTEAGWQSAEKVLRMRRLWEVFLVEHLHYDIEQADELACRLEHTVPEETALRLAEFLGWPSVSPQGKPIAYPEQSPALPRGVPVNELPAESAAAVVSVRAAESEAAFLASAGVQAGVVINVVAVQKNGPCLLKIGEGEPISLSSKLAGSVLVEKR